MRANGTISPCLKLKNTHQNFVSMTISNQLNSFKKWLSNGLGVLLFTVLMFAFFAFLAALSWPVLSGLRVVGDAVFIPYAKVDYWHLAGVFSSFPTSGLGLASIPFSEMPNSFIVFGWWFAVLAQVIGFYWGDRHDLPKKFKKGQTRAQLLRQLLLRKLRLFAIYTVFAALLCVPGLRSYQILTSSHVKSVGYFSWHEKSVALADLTEVWREQGSGARSIISWRLTFKTPTGDESMMLVAPNIEALARILVLPGVKSNVALVHGRLVHLESVK